METASEILLTLSKDYAPASQIEAMLLRRLSEYVEEYGKALSLLASEGLVLLSGNGYRMPHPAVSIKNNAMKNIISICKLVGTTGQLTEDDIKKDLLGA